MIDHISLQVADLAASSTFYDAVLATIGGEAVMRFDETVGYGTQGQPVFWIGRQATDQPNKEVHVAFHAADRPGGRLLRGRGGHRGRGAPRAPGVARVPPQLLRGLRARPRRQQRRGRVPPAGMTGSDRVGFDLDQTDHLLATTRSVRRRLDLDRPVPRPLLMDCIRLAVQAPTGGNAQTWRWLVVDDDETKAELGRIDQRTGARPGVLPARRHGRRDQPGARLGRVPGRRPGGDPAMVIP